MSPSPEEVEAVFDGAIDLEASALGAYLDHACGDDVALRTAVVALLDADKKMAERARAPRRVGAFELGRKLGEGGMGVVYEAHDARLDRNVALTLVRLGAPDEARALAKVAHPNVVPVYEVGVSGDEVFIAMELVDGETLASWLARERRSWREILTTFVAAGRGLEAAHAAGIVHGDFKPDNVLIGKDGRPRVVDFGLASATPRAGAFNMGLRPNPRGTPAYMSPEHFRGETTDVRSDQFAFGIALYRALFGTPPFAGKDLITIRNAVLGGALEPVPPTDVPVADAIVRALATAPAERWPSMTALLAALEAPLARTLDPAPARGKRRVAAALLTLAGIATLLPPLTSATVPGLLALAVFALVALAVLGVVFRRMLLESAYNRRIALTFTLPVAGFVVHRALAIRLGTRVEDVLVGDAIATGVLLAFAAITIERWMGIVTILALVYAVGATFFPAWAAPAFGTFLCISSTIPVLLWRRPHGEGRARRKKIGSRVGPRPASADDS